MKKFNASVVLFILLLIAILLFKYSLKLGIEFFVFLIIMELISYFLVNKLRQDFQWLITPKDELPVLSREGLKKFIKSGYDEELGWIRKPNTEKEEIGKEGKTMYHIDSKGSRKNPGHENLPVN